MMCLKRIRACMRCACSSPKATFDAVITDYAMPGMNGLELAHKVHARNPELRVILATGYAELPTNAPVDFPRLSKPYTQEELVGSPGAGVQIATNAPAHVPRSEAG